MRMFDRLRTLFRRFWLGSIYRQLTLAFALPVALLMLIFGCSLIRQEREFLMRQSIEHARDIAHTISVGCAAWMAAGDIAKLQEEMKNVSRRPSVRYAMVMSPDGLIVASTAEAYMGRFINDEASRGLIDQADPYPHVLAQEDQIIEVAAPVFADTRLVGWVRIGVGRDESQENLRDVSLQEAWMAGLAIAMVILIAVSISRRFAGGLRQLMQAMKLVQAGRRDVRADDARADELGVLARNFNGMLDSLAESERKLERLNRVYAAWTQSNEALVREADEQVLLERICGIMAECVPFKLVWVGMVDAGGWVHVIASSDPQSVYLRDHARISVDAEKPEGRVAMAIAIRQGIPQIHNDFLNPDNVFPWKAAAQAEQFRSVAAFPLRRNGSCVGALGYYSTEINFFDLDVVALMRGLSDDVSFALDSFDHERRRRDAEAQLVLASRVFENSMEGIIITDAERNIISVNPGFTEITGYTLEEALGQTPRILSSGQQEQQFYQAMWRSVEASGSWRGEISNRRKNGEFYPEWLTISRVLDESGRVSNYIGVFTDISERKTAEARIQHLAYFDALTDLPNRILLRDRLEQAIIKAQRANEKVAVLFLDLDRFKVINDTLGHGVGDGLLKVVSKRLLDCVREQDTVSRQGGDEFLAILPDTDAEGAELVAQKMLSALTGPCPVEGHTLYVTPSIGISLYPDNATDIDELVKLADVAMYRAKDRGRNNYQFYSTLARASA